MMMMGGGGEKQQGIGEKFTMKSFIICVFPFSGPTVHVGPWPPLLRFRNSSFLWCGVVSPTPNPQPGGPCLRINDPPETGWPSYTPGHWVARVPRGCHSPYPPLWAPEGKICALRQILLG
jgi:hypothetical protein